MTGLRRRLAVALMLLVGSVGMVGGAVAFGVFGYVLAICALVLLPETHGRELGALE